MTRRISRHGLLCWTILFGLLGAGVMKAQGPVEYPGPPPGEAKASVTDAYVLLSNSVLEYKWIVEDGHLSPIYVGTAGRRIELGECFELVLPEGRILKASDLTVLRGPDVDTLRPDPRAQRLGARNGGKQVRVTLVASDGNLTIQWRAELRDASNYVRQYVTLVPKKADVDIREIILAQEPAQADSGMKAAGTLDGSPIADATALAGVPVTSGHLFRAFEHPLAKVRMRDSMLQCSLPLSRPLKVGDEPTYSSVTGTAPYGQLRRAFLYYVERERAQPYRLFLHYNSWYDIGYGPEKILEPDALKVIELFGRELVERRQVTMDSFVLDDGWDDPATLWRFHEGYPEGFTRLEQAAQGYHSAIGAWLSPWGGYGKAKEERMKYGLKEGFETNKNGFSMAGPKYYARFRDACLGMVRDYNLNYFKFDGISSGGVPTGAPAESAADVEALLRLIGDLRAAKPDLFINVTTGTWSSPYWLWYADSTWRSGSDWGTCGWGSRRQQQITYRDNETYKNVVSRAPLYPLNSLMTQGVMFANHGLPDEPEGLVEDIRAFFASGTNCQELYVTPSLLDTKAWDALAEAAKWSRDNADVLVDTHWVGGDPIEGQVYGWASWSRRKGILGLRNPKDAPGRITIDVGRAFELPNGAAQRYSLTSPWKADAATPAIVLSPGTEHTFELRPFEVLVFDALPR